MGFICVTLLLVFAVVFNSFELSTQEQQRNNDFPQSSRSRNNRVQNNRPTRNGNQPNRAQAAVNGNGAQVVNNQFNTQEMLEAIAAMELRGRNPNFVFPTGEYNHPAFEHPDFPTRRDKRRVYDE